MLLIDRHLVRLSLRRFIDLAAERAVVGRKVLREALSVEQLGDKLIVGGVLNAVWTSTLLTTGMKIAYDGPSWTTSAESVSMTALRMSVVPLGSTRTSGWMTLEA